MMNRYLQERGDANIKTSADLISKARFYEDPNFPDRKQARQAAERATVLDTSARLQTRFALQNLLLQCMAGTAARRASLPDVHCPATKAHGAARTEREWPLSDWLVAHRAARFPRYHRTCGLYDGDLGSRARWRWRHALGRPSSKLTCPSALTSSRVRLTKRCYSASPRLSKRQPGIESPRRTSGQCPANRNLSSGVGLSMPRLSRHESPVWVESGIATYLIPSESRQLGKRRQLPDPV